MSPAQRLPKASARTPPRWMLGLRGATDGQFFSAALLSVTGQGLALSATQAAAATAPIPDDVNALWRQAELGASYASLAGSDLWIQLAATAARTSQLQAELAANLITGARIHPTEQVLAIGLDDPGWWYRKQGAVEAYQPLSDPICLAEATGLNVISGFAARDVVLGGQGGPLEALPLWLLFRHPERTRAVLEIGPTVRLTTLPRRRSADDTGDILAFDVGPGTRFLQAVLAQLGLDPNLRDSGGSLAVQGQVIEPVLTALRQDAYFAKPLPRWQPEGVLVERFVATLFEQVDLATTSALDILATATRLVAQEMLHAIESTVPAQPPLKDLIVYGPGTQNGLLLTNLADRFPQVHIRRPEDYGFDARTLPAACTAILAALAMDQVPGNLPQVTGASVARVLGQVTPGSPPNWYQLLRTAGTNPPSWMRLRSAM